MVVSHVGTPVHNALLLSMAVHAWRGAKRRNDIRIRTLSNAWVQVLSPDCVTASEPETKTTGLSLTKTGGPTLTNSRCVAHRRMWFPCFSLNEHEAFLFKVFVQDLHHIRICKLHIRQVFHTREQVVHAAQSKSGLVLPCGVSAGEDDPPSRLVPIKEEDGCAR
jgi:hypothetical protein